MNMLNHHIYEYKKGVRDLVLYTMHSRYREKAINKLELNNIPYIIRDVSLKKINIFFGSNECINVLEKFGNKRLTDFSPEEDFILGIMLGYSRDEQYKRILKRFDKLSNIHCK